MSLSINPLSARESLRALPDVAAWENLDAPPLRDVYVPVAHKKALSLDNSVVVGMRGAGKSFWTAALLSNDVRETISREIGLTELERTVASIGFGLDTSNTDFPGPGLLKDMADQQPADIWLGTVLRHALNRAALPSPCANIRDMIRWVSTHRSEADGLLKSCDESMAESGRRLLILFDALDRLSPDWEGTRRHIAEILQICLRFRSYRSMRLKLFLRPEMYEDEAVWKFADSSKLKHADVELTWHSSDLFGLILFHLANNDAHGAEFRKAVARGIKVKWKQGDGGVYALPPQLLADTAGKGAGGPLRSVVEALAGQWMGSNRKRGYTFTWIPLHLSDAVGRVSPRSFMLALRHAAEWTRQNQPNHRNALHFRGIEYGVTEASRIRVQEIREDYPWVAPLLEAARGLAVPCSVRDLMERWDPDRLQAVRTAGKLLPRRFSTDPFRREKPEALVDDLVELAVLYRAEDGRLNMPDIFRVDFGIRRRGGVRPVR